MLIFPLIMNAVQYYIIDSFIKNNQDPEQDDLRQAENSHEEAAGLLPTEEEPDVEEEDPSPDETRKQASVKINAGLAQTQLDVGDKEDGPDTRAGESSTSSSASTPEEHAATRPSTARHTDVE